MAALISMVISATNQTNAAFGSAEQNLTSLGNATTQTTHRMDVLSDRIEFQQRRLALLERQIQETTAAHGADSVQVERQQIRYEELTRTITRNEQSLDRLHREQREGNVATGIAERNVGGLALATGKLASAYIGLEVAQRGTEFIRSSLDTANAFADVDTTVRALADSTELYNQTLTIAVANQQRMGGSMAAQLEGMTALLPLVRTTNAELQTLALTQQLLVARQPREGVGGAAYAIQELLSSDTAEAGLSIRDRFNLPPARVNALIARTRGDQEGRLQGVIDLLAEQGIDEETLQKQAQNATQPFKQLSAAWSNFMLREGEAAQRVLGPFARIATAGLNLVSSSPNVGQALSGDMGGWSATNGYVINNVTVQGSVITEKQLADRVRQLNSQTGARNGVQTRR